MNVPLNPGHRSGTRTASEEAKVAELVRRRCLIVDLWRHDLLGASSFHDVCLELELLHVVAYILGQKYIGLRNAIDRHSLHNVHLNGATV